MKVGAAVLCLGIALFAWPAEIASGAGETPLVVEDANEQELREIAERLRCPVCQGENVYDSRSDLAGEMRTIIREQLAAGAAQSEIIDFFVARYGDYVRLEPGSEGTQFLIWLMPAILVVIGFAIVTWIIRRRAPAQVEGSAGESSSPLNRLGGPEK